MMHEIWWSLPLTLIVFFLARKLAARFKFPLLNPLLVAMVVIIPFLLLTGISYERYFAGSKVLNDLLQPAVVALAFPLYEQLPLFCLSQSLRRLLWRLAAASAAFRPSAPCA